ncbi:uncharacterized protein MONOS_10719 [Monocercomonoides exilis]|uniref:uncharacterized protein n=1 Tax=Monocercomonoides exilis TaxID=2049356 RepID=UPI003559648C|nr:hypothetical protein MONOS_10719 [Monocercomonoides exilis]|eukprot:MONOS_10719.1-p1 / transcript=MONOS_10719.1 / gene=MONOS_10719 / organism=Monocercomonoides_exilis_PA203 / gene_product=unspecified product / transcript_product=unspecified product / location=Mono_scaffold00498:6163-8120(+) / protein_length=556 / sequence_SO=supercontig / SO=protein_coding / is_pseudo=false
MPKSKKTRKSKIEEVDETTLNEKVEEKSESKEDEQLMNNETIMIDESILNELEEDLQATLENSKENKILVADMQAEKAKRNRDELSNLCSPKVHQDISVSEQPKINNEQLQNRSANSSTPREVKQQQQIKSNMKTRKSQSFPSSDRSVILIDEENDHDSESSKEDQESVTDESLYEDETDLSLSSELTKASIQSQKKDHKRNKTFESRKRMRVSEEESSSDDNKMKDDKKEDEQEDNWIQKMEETQKLFEGETFKPYLVSKQERIQAMKYYGRKPIDNIRKEREQRINKEMLMRAQREKEKEREINRNRMNEKEKERKIEKINEKEKERKINKIKEKEKEKEKERHSDEKKVRKEQSNTTENEKTKQEPKNEKKQSEFEFDFDFDIDGPLQNAMVKVSQMPQTLIPEKKLTGRNKEKVEHRKRWTPVEDKLLLRGISKHGTRWAAIAKDETIDLGKTDAQLKDRYRILIRDPIWKRIIEKKLSEVGKVGVRSRSAAGRGEEEEEEEEEEDEGEKEEDDDLMSFGGKKKKNEKEMDFCVVSMEDSKDRIEEDDDEIK